MEASDDRLSAAGVDLVCPACGEAFPRARAPDLCCPGCSRVYPVVAGLPDLRLRSDRFLSLEEDRAKGLRVVDSAADSSYAAALVSYWRHTPETSAALADLYRKRQRAEEEIGRRTYAEVQRVAGRGTGPLLDLGCGLGGLVEAAAAAGRPAVGVDAAFRWLLVAQRRLGVRPSPAWLLGGAAEAPPVRAVGGFSTVVLNDVLEHADDPERIVRAAAELLAAGGRLYIASNNRWSIAPEPHVRLPGVGWLPRAWQRPYVRTLSRRDYSRVRLPSRGEVAGWVRDAGLRVVDAGAAPVYGPHLSGPSQAVAAAAQRLGPLSPRFYVLAESA